MADVVKGEASFAITATNNYVLGDVSDGAVGLMTIHLTAAGGGWSGNIVVKARARGSAQAFLAIPYIPLHLNGSAGDGVQVSTTITTTSLIVLDASGLDVSLDVTYTSGSITVGTRRSVAG